MSDNINICDNPGCELNKGNLLKTAYAHEVKENHITEYQMHGKEFHLCARCTPTFDLALDIVKKILSQAK